MSDLASPQYDVLLGTCDDVPAAVVAEAIAACKKIPFQDAMHDVRAGWGFLGKNLPEDEAERLVAAVQSKGVAARLVAHDDIAPLPELQLVKNVVFDAAGLRLIGAAGDLGTFAPAHLSVVAAAALATRSVTTKKVVEGGRSNVEKLVNVGLLLSGIPISIGKKAKVVEKTTVKQDLFFHLDLLMREPSARFRIDAESVRYAFLQERMVHNTLQNFKIFLKDLTEWAPQARLNKGARFFLKNLVLSQMGYESFANLEEEMRWLSAL
jgi:hypothetical protein